MTGPGLLDRLAPLEAAMTGWRHDLHAHPELAFEERRTAALVASVLEGAGIAVDRGLGETAVIATIRGRRPGDRAVGLRADLDALPIRETGTPLHVSRHPGAMHACGHDGHTAMLLGAALHLAETRNFAGVVHAIFQPAEEARDGARTLLARGLFRRFPVEAVFGLHNWPGLPAGTIAVHRGAVMAACDGFVVTVRGRGGHAAMPHLAIDPVLVAGHLVTAIQSLVSRGVDPAEGAVVSVTGLEAGDAFNVIPDTVTLRGTIRSLLPETRAALGRRLERLATAIAEGFGATARVEIDDRATATVNHPDWVEPAARAAARVLGAGNVVRDAAPSMTAEDFGDLLAARPGAYVWLGQGGGASLHASDYDFNDAVLTVGAAYWVALVEEILG